MLLPLSLWLLLFYSKTNVIQGNTVDEQRVRPAGTEVGRATGGGGGGVVPVVAAIGWAGFPSSPEKGDSFQDV
jgi:hypothetical protein